MFGIRPPDSTSRYTYLFSCVYFQRWWRMATNFSPNGSWSRCSRHPTTVESLTMLGLWWALTKRWCVHFRYDRLKKDDSYDSCCNCLAILLIALVHLLGEVVFISVLTDSVKLSTALFRIFPNFEMEAK